MISVKVRERGKERFLQMYYIDPLTGAYRTKSARTMNRKEAERAAALWEQELAAKGPGPNGCNWEAFRNRFEDEHLANLPDSTRASYVTCLNSFEKYAGKPRSLEGITPSVLSQYCARMRTEGELSPHTIAKNVRHVRSALSWGVSVSLLRSVPKFKSPSTRGKRKMKGRPLTTAEIAKLKTAAKKVRPDDYRDFQWLIDGLNLSGLRLEEATALSWDSPPVLLDLDSSKFPRIVFSEDGHKSGDRQTVPITPDFADLLKAVPAGKRHGRVFPVVFEAGKYLSAIGKKAKVFVNEQNKPASAHDLRRTFGTRWAARLRPLALKTLMRHKTVSTTLEFYVDQDSDEVGAEIWGSVHASVHDAGSAEKQAAGRDSKNRPKKR